jgi:hypothetical protein
MQVVRGAREGAKHGNRERAKAACGAREVTTTAWVPDDREKLRLLKEKAARSRTSLTAFFEFVMREEATRARMRVAPHQKIIFSFVQHPAHSKCVLILPIDHSKTFCMLTYALFQLAGDTNRRGLVMSKTQRQAAKIVTTMRQIIDGEPRIRLVNPKMVRSRRGGDKWADTSFTVMRDLGQKDPSFAAAGLDTAIGGYRLEFAIADDILDHENTRTPERRKETLLIIDRMLKGRMLAGSRLVFTNSTFHSADALNVLRSTPAEGGPGLPALVMSADGNVHVYNEDPGWDTPGLYSASSDPTHFRLADNDPEDTLWPDRYSRERLEEKRRDYVHDPGGFARLYLSATHDDSTAVCKQEFIDACLEMARKHGACGVVGSKTEGFQEFYGWRPSGTVPQGEVYMTFTGVDLAVQQKDTADLTCFFTFECNRPDGKFRILDIEYGRWDAMTIARKAIDKAKRFKSALAVENNGAQNYLLDVIRHMLTTPAKGRDGVEIRGVMEMDSYVHVEALTTSESSKSSPEYGLETFFYEMARGMWLFPNRDGVMRREVAELCKACKEYTPTTHPNDILMAAHMARRLASRVGGLGKSSAGGGGGGVGNVLMR